MEQYLISLATSHHYEVYAIIMALGFFEGPFVSMASGAVLSSGYLNFFPLYLVLMLGDLLGDSLWYLIGYNFGYKFVSRFGKYVGIREKEIKIVEKIFVQEKYKILLASKITNGLGLSMAILFTAGMSKINFLKFISINAVGQLFWSGILIALGFFFGDLYLRINSISSKVFLVIVFVLLIVAFFRFRKYMKNKYE